MPLSIEYKVEDVRSTGRRVYMLTFSYASEREIGNRCVLVARARGIRGSLLFTEYCSMKVKKRGPYIRGPLFPLSAVLFAMEKAIDYNILTDLCILTTNSTTGIILNSPNPPSDEKLRVVYKEIENLKSSFGDIIFRYIPIEVVKDEVSAIREDIRNLVESGSL